ncbi:MAG: hypothetical protein EA425_17580 [Puniceicoccaceae bacterium]|nr:MAG: hypothetical protein EA425_17580 [Puniceicoccaceae bacterium]
MNSRERFHALMNFQPVDRLPLVEWAHWWDKTIARWHTEGLPAALTDRYAIGDFFGLERYRQEWLRSIHWDAPKPTHHGAGLLGDDDPEAAYERLRPHLFQILDQWPVHPDGWQALAAEQARGDCVAWFTVDGFFWLPRTLFGIEGHLYAFYDHPELMHRINEDNTEWMLRLLDRICAHTVPDFMTFAEDLSYNHGPMLSEAMFDEFMTPYYQRIIPRLRERGIRVFIDSDGDVTTAIPWFERAGIEGILPLERQAGADLAAIRARHPRFLVLGHFDKLVMAKGEAALRAEFERLLPIARQGGFIISCDHQTPPEVSLEDYRLYLKLFREYSLVNK